MNQYSEMLASSSSREMAFSITPPQSDQARNFSAIHAASPAGESLRPKASVCGLVPWIHW